MASYARQNVNTPLPRPRVLLVDDHQEVPRQVAQLLSRDFDVVATLSDGRALSQNVEEHHSDLVVLDITLPGASGIELARRLAASVAPPKIVFLTVHADPDYAREALDAGGLGYVVKSRLASDLVPALNAALLRNRFVSPSPIFAALARPPNDP